MSSSSADDSPPTKKSGTEIDKTRTSQVKCLMNLVKGNLGTGVLALPLAFRNAGIWIGVAGMLFLGYISLHCMRLLTICNDHVRKRTNSGPLGYADVAEACVATGPKWLQKYKGVVPKIVNVFIVSIQLGACTVYVLFVADNLEQVIKSSDAPDPVLDKIVMASEFVILVLFCTTLQSLKALAYMSTIANILQICGITIIMYDVCIDLPNIDERIAVGRLNTVPLFFGVAVYSFEGIGLIMPLKNKVQDEYDFGRTCGILTLGITIVIALYITVGFFGYLKYGDAILPSITLNVPAVGWLGKTTKMMFVVAIFFTYRLQFYVPMSIIWPAVEGRLKSDTSKFWVKLAIEAGLVLFTCTMAIIIPDLGLLISLGGALFCTSVQFMFPPLLQIITFSAEGETLSYATVIKNVLIILMGLTGMCAGTYVCIERIIETF